MTFFLVRTPKHNSHSSKNLLEKAIIINFKKNKMLGFNVENLKYKN